MPCRLEPFAGARFDYLAANVVRADGTTIFPPTAIRQVGPIRIGFIGMTLKDTGILVTPAGVAGLHFADEAATANALVPELKAQGADAIVLLIHQGGKVPDTYDRQGCDGLSGDILPILDKLDPAIPTVVSGHTHRAYACELDRGGAGRLLTSAGKYGYFVTDLRLDLRPVDPPADRRSTRATSPSAMASAATTPRGRGAGRSLCRSGRAGRQRASSASLPAPRRKMPTTEANRRPPT